IHGTLPSVRQALRLYLDVPDRTLARGVSADERRRLVTHLPASRPAAAHARPRRGLDLHRDRLLPRARLLRTALLAGQGGALDRDLGAVARRAPDRGGGPRRDADRRADRPRRRRIQARRPARRQGSLLARLEVTDLVQTYPGARHE